MENGQGSLRSLLTTLTAADARVFVRVACKAGTQAIWHTDAIVAPPAEPAGWQAQVWEYESATFIAGEVSSRALAAALEPEDAQVLQLGPYSLTLPVLTDHLTWERRPSRARYDSIALPWPTVTFALNRPGRPDTQTPSQYLIGDDCPSFFSYERAFRAFFYNEFTGPLGHQVPSDAAVIRVVNATAWFERVVIKPTYMDVLVSGSDVTGVRVELNGSTYRTHTRVNDSGQVRLPLLEGLPDGSWLYLSRDKKWLDYRAIGEYGQADLERAGVEVDFPDDPETAIQVLLASGEGQQIEFKRQLPGTTVESKRTIFKTVAAFANGSGGSVVFGVEKDEATVCGLGDTDPLTERDRLIQLARSTVTPAPEVDVRRYEIDGKTILVLSVEGGADAPYGITPGSKDKPVEFCVRRGATTFPARPEEIRNSVLATAPSAAAGPRWAPF